MNQMTPIAAGIASLGRGNDKMLVHMTPGEVQGLQSLAMAHGGSLTINPQTGLPEAGFLENILPTVLGVGLSFMGVPAWAAGLGVGAFQGLRTGDLGQGLMAGLQAFGGAGLGGALGSMGASAPSTVAANLGVEGASALPGSQAAMLAEQTAGFGNAGLDAIRSGASAAPGVSLGAAPSGFSNALTGVQQLGQPGGLSQFGSELMDQYGGKMGATAAGIGALGAMGGLEQQQLKLPTPEEQKSNYRKQGPIQRPYDPTAPGGYYFADRGILQPNFLAAKGGEVPSVPQLEDGGFVLTKKAVDGIGGGDNARGQRRAAAGLGAIPIKGPGTGTSDSIRTSIDGVRPAAVSNGESYIPRDQVKRRGGAKKFYALMKKAERAAGKRRS
jgi:hypothetical protein